MIFLLLFIKYILKYILNLKLLGFLKLFSLVILFYRKVKWNQRSDIIFLGRKINYGKV